MVAVLQQNRGTYGMIFRDHSLEDPLRIIFRLAGMDSDGFA